MEVPTINGHTQKIYADHELDDAATIRNFRIVQTEGCHGVHQEKSVYRFFYQ